MAKRVQVEAFWCSQCHEFQPAFMEKVNRQRLQLKRVSKSRRILLACGHQRAYEGHLRVGPSKLMDFYGRIVLKSEFAILKRLSDHPRVITSLDRQPQPARHNHASTIAHSPDCPACK